MTYRMQGQESHRIILIAAIAVALLSLMPDNVLSDGWSWSQDWMWFIAAAVGIAVTVYSGGFRETPTPGSLTVFAVIPLVLQIVLATVRMFEASEMLWFLSLIMQTWAATAFGYMLALALDRKTDIRISNRWRILFAIMFACAFGGLYIFYIFVDLWLAGYPVYNYELIEYVERIEINKKIMAPATVATFGSIVASLALRSLTKEPKEDSV